MGKVTVVGWDQYDHDADTIGWMGGWFNFHENGMRWADYLTEIYPPLQQYVEAVRAKVIEDGLRDITGARHQNGWAPKFSDGKVMRLSYRAWGDLMAAIWSEYDDEDHNYMEFYC